MADTIRGDFPNSTCTDCGKQGVTMIHWGPLTTPGTKGNYCSDCWTKRQDYYNQHGQPMPAPAAATSTDQ